MSGEDNIIETRLGKVHYVLTDAKHVYISTSARNVDGFCLTLRGIPYYASIHLYDDEAGWAPRAHHDFHVRRKDCFDNDRVSAAAERDLKAAVIEAWKNAVTPEMRHQADVAAVNDQIERQDEKVKELRDKLLEEEKALAELHQKADDLEAASLSA